MNKYNVLASLTLVVSLGAGTTSAASMDEVSAKLVPSSIRETGILRIAMPDQGRPFAYREGTNLKGMDPDLAVAVAETLGLEPNIELVPFDAALTGLQAGKFDVSYGEFYIRPERLAVADFVTSWETYGSFLIRKGSDFAPETMSDLCGRKAAAMAGSVNLSDLQRKAADCPSDKPMEISVFPSTSNAVLALSSSRIDAVYLDRGAAGAAASANPSLMPSGRLAPAVMAIAIKRGEATVGLPEAVQAALSHLKNTGEYLEILQKNGVEYGAIEKFDIYNETSTPPVYE